MGPLDPKSNPCCAWKGTPKMKGLDPRILDATNNWHCGQNAGADRANLQQACCDYDPSGFESFFTNNPRSADFCWKKTATYWTSDSVGFAAEDTTEFAWNEGAWLTELQQAWAKATGNGFANLKALGSCA